MIGMTNTEGLGLSDNDAILRVQAPANSIVTISKGSIIKHDEGHENKDDSFYYDYYFIIHSSQFDATNPWTITATLGSQIKINTIIIKEADEYDVLIRYDVYLFEAGDQSGWASEAWSCKNSAGAHDISLSYSDEGLILSQTNYHSGIAYYTQKVDLSTYSAVTAHGDFSYSRSERWDGSGIYILSSVSVSSYYPTKAVAATELPMGTFTDYDLVVDVSSLVGEYYIVIGLVMTSNYSIDKVYCTTM